MVDGLELGRLGVPCRPSALMHKGWVRCDTKLNVGDFAAGWIIPDSEFALIVVTNSGDDDYGGLVTNELVHSVVDLLP
jgi:hypothetical protein